jgi:hypothetical protein
LVLWRHLGAIFRIEVLVGGYIPAISRSSVASSVRRGERTYQLRGPVYPPESSIRLCVASSSSDNQLAGGVVLPNCTHSFIFPTGPAQVFQISGSEG